MLLGAVRSISVRSPLAKGFTAGSDMYGNQIAAQLPTRRFTLVVSGYRGADMRQVLGALFKKLHYHVKDGGRCRVALTK